jgi:hypothetical protein
MKSAADVSPHLRFFRFTLIPVFVAGWAEALEVTPDSYCALDCFEDLQNDIRSEHPSFTRSEQVVCHDWELDGSNKTVKGQLWKKCLTWESTVTSWIQRPTRMMFIGSYVRHHNMLLRFG